MGFAPFPRFKRILVTAADVIDVSSMTSHRLRQQDVIAMVMVKMCGRTLNAYVLKISRQYHDYS